MRSALIIATFALSVLAAPVPVADGQTPARRAADAEPFVRRPDGRVTESRDVSAFDFEKRQVRKNGRREAEAVNKLNNWGPRDADAELERQVRQNGRREAEAEIEEPSSPQEPPSFRMERQRPHRSLEDPWVQQRSYPAPTLLSRTHDSQTAESTFHTCDAVSSLSSCQFHCVFCLFRPRLENDARDKVE
ncbi:hypothetical protein BDV96DRAFT_341117 [Lophiotrema nucula]|uniref:Uncharacterized protein n=1 Tax=Lophiotrema nucula TaxID=690887 RepID=A0A6A5ZJJ1_9PLEO|nr:hypothetical protein BDV96DRAFT_341117 [Lophiotrema nucula]